MMIRNAILPLLASTLVAVNGLAFAGNEMPAVNGTVGNLRVHREVHDTGFVQYWLVEKVRYDKKSDTVNLQTLREGSNGRIMDMFTFDAPCSHRKFMYLETIVTNPLGPHPDVRTHYDSKSKYGHTAVSKQIVDAACPKK